METKEINIVRSFNNAINEGNVELLSSLMAEDHTFVDASGAAHSGVKEMTEGWIDFFRMFPDYGFVLCVFRDILDKWFNMRLKMALSRKA